MATTVDTLLIEIKAETAKLQKGLSDVNRKLNTTNKTARQSVLTFGNLAKVFAAVGAVQIGGAIAGTAREFEDLEATLKAVTGSSEAAKDSFELIKQFTATTTFQVQNVATAFTTLLNAGITPTSDTMKDFGNIAAAFGKDITQIAQATFNATTGETEMLKQFGIKAKLEGDKITMVFREQETTIGRNSEEIVGYLRSIAQEDFSTALDDRAKTASGAISNLKDAISITMAAVGEAGLLSVLTDASLALKKVAEDAKPTAEIIGRSLKVAFDGLKVAINFVVQNISLLLTGFKVFVMFKIAGFAIAAATGFGSLAKSILATNLATISLNKNMKRNLILLAVTGTIALADAFFDLTGKIEAALTEAGKAVGILNDEENKKTEKSIDDLNKSIEKVTANMKEDMGPELENMAEFSDELQQAVTNAANSFTNEFVDSLLRGESALQSFKDFSRSIVSQIISIFLQLEIVNRILANIFPNFEGTVGTGLFANTGAGGGGGSGSGSASAFGGIPVSGPQPMSVGGGVAAASGKAQSVTVVQNLNFATGLNATVRNEVLQLLPTIADVTSSAISEQARRSPRFRGAFSG